VYCFLPETSSRSLEAIDFLFASESPFVWNEEAEFRKRMAELEQRWAQVEDQKSGIEHVDSTKGQTNGSSIMVA
jgi:hypothetical protein